MDDRGLGLQWIGRDGGAGRLSDAVAISAGWIHSLALRSDGTVVAWGDNRYGQVTVPAGLTDVVAITAGGWHNLALKADGTVVAWGNNAAGQSMCRQVPSARFHRGGGLRRREMQTRSALIRSPTRSQIPRPTQVP